MCINTNKVIRPLLGGVLNLTLILASNLAFSSSAFAAVTNSGSGTTSYATMGVDFGIYRISINSTNGVSNSNFDRGVAVTSNQCGNAFGFDTTPNNPPGGKVSTLVDGQATGVISTLTFNVAGVKTVTNNTEAYCLIKDSVNNYWSYKRAPGATGDAHIQACASTGSFNPASGCTAAAASSSSSSSPSSSTIHVSVSRSQSLVVGKNIGTRISLAFNTDSPSGVGRDIPGGAGRDKPGTLTNFSAGGLLNALTNVDNNRIGFSQTSATSLSSQGISDQEVVRELAMLASFDTSQMILAAAGNDNDPLGGSMGGVQPRSDLLLDRPYTIWGHGSYTNMDNTRNNTGDDSRYSGDVWGYNLGADYRLNPNLFAGVSLGYSETDITTTYNTGTYEEKTYSLSPYVLFQPMEGVKFSAIAGYSVGNMDLTRNTSVTGNTDSAMWFGGVNGSYKYTPNPDLALDLTAQIGIMMSGKKVDAYSESDGTAVAASTSNTRQIKPGLEAAYRFNVGGTTVQPFAKADYIYDFTDATNADSGAYGLGGGVRFASGAKGLNGSIKGDKQIGRSDYSEYSVSAMIAYGFALDGGDSERSNMVEPYLKTSFARTAQEFGSGIKYTHGKLPLSANFDVSQSVPETGVDGELNAKIRVVLRF